MTLQPDQRAQLLGAKLRGLVPVAGDAPGAEPSVFAGGAALVVGSEAWVLLDEDPAKRLGWALAWSRRRDVDRLHVLAARDAGILARRAAEFAVDLQVWQIVDRELRRAAPAPPPEVRQPSAVALEAAALLVEHGVEIVVEHGEVHGAIRGLEVVRVVEEDGGARLEVGVGQQDREAFSMLHGELDVDSGVAAVAATVRSHRRAGAPDHPLGRMAAERWLRWHLREHPHLVGARQLEQVEGTLPRTSVDEVTPAFLLGSDASGAPLVVACATGIDLDLVPAAADARAMHAPEARLVLAVPERDAHRVTHDLASALRHPAQVLPLPTQRM